MLAVLVCGLIKTLIVIWTCIHHGQISSLRTFGDAVESFLAREDETTKNLCLVSPKSFVKNGLEPYEPQLYTGLRQRWYISAGIKQFWTSISTTISYAILLSVALAYAIEGAQAPHSTTPWVKQTSKLSLKPNATTRAAQG